MKLKDWKKKEFTATLAYTVSGADILAALDIPASSPRMRCWTM